LSLKFCSPEEIPDEIKSYDKKILQMDVGQTGKVGYLKINLEYDSHRNKTVITHQKSQVPLYIQKALYYDEAFPSMSHIFVLSPSGGILQGDRYRIDITLTKNAISHITTQGATRIYKMNSNYATQIINLNVGKNCYLEFIPEQLIPYKNSRYFQKINFNVDKTATLFYSEIIVPGRVAMGELFDYDICYLKSIAKLGQEILFNDSCILEPKKQKINLSSILGNNTILASVYVLTKKENISVLKQKIDCHLEANDEVDGGVSVLPNECGLGIRILCNSSEDTRTTIYQIAKIVRKETFTDS
jgi:urease accessory protein